MRGMIVGRFQPFHNGHLQVIEHILTEVDDMIIIIAASQQSHQPNNPFTAGERYDMIHNTLVKELKNFRVIIIPANDVKDNGLWVSHLKRLVPKFDVVYTNNPLTEYLFKEAGIKVKSTPFFDRDDFNAEHIRDLMIANNKEWKKLVPKEVAKVIENIKGIDRIRTINSSDKDVK